MENYLINIPYNNTDIKGYVYNNFDYQTDLILYEQLDDDEIPIIYNTLHKHILSLPKNKRPIVFSSDYAISSSTCTAITEKYMEINICQNKETFISPIKILYFTPIHHLNDLLNISQHSFSKSILSNILGNTEISYSKHSFLISSEQIILIGLNDFMLEQEDIDKLNNLNITYFTLTQLRKKSISDICEHILEIINGDPVYIIYDLSVVSTIFAPCVLRFINKEQNLENQLDGLSEEDIIAIFEKFKVLNIIGLDITGYNIKKETLEKQIIPTIKCIKFALVNLLQIKEKRINVFNENTKFIIFRPVAKSNPNDFGWYILKGIPLTLEAQMIEQLELSDDNLTIFGLGDEDIYIAISTIEEQEKKSYYQTESIYECTLMPEEKAKMIFYLMAKNF